MLLLPLETKLIAPEIFLSQCLYTLWCHNNFTRIENVLIVEMSFKIFFTQKNGTESKKKLSRDRSNASKMNENEKEKVKVYFSLMKNKIKEFFSKWHFLQRHLISK